MSILLLVFKVFLVSFFCICYALGGQSSIGKWVRRFLGAGVFGAGVILLSILSGHFGIFALMAGGWYIPSLILFKYGVNDGKVWKKVLLRGVYGASLGLGGLFAGISTGNIGLGVFQVILAASGSIFFGVLNPFAKYGDKGVMLEDACIALCAVGVVPFIV